jgi:protein-disulfide isomerase
MKSTLLSLTFAGILGLMADHSLVAQTEKRTEPTIVASFPGVVITQEDLKKYSARDLENLDLERTRMEANLDRSRSQLLERNLYRILEEKLLQAEAVQRGVGVEQLLAMELEGKVKDPTEEDVKNYYEANKQNINQPLLQVGSQIFQYLKTENYNNAKTDYISQLKEARGVVVAMEPLRSKVETNGSPDRGPAGAPVTIVEFSDFQCPYCANMSSTLQQVMAKYRTQVRLVYRNFPLAQIHPNAEKAAEAGLCAGDQGHFWEMHDLMFQTRNLLKDEDLKAKAAQLKLDTDKFNSCLISGATANRVKQDMYAGAKLGLTGTPGLFINGRFVPGAVPLADITKIIDEELKTALQIAKKGN